jgi:hypothetical protein
MNLADEEDGAVEIDYLISKTSSPTLVGFFVYTFTVR